MRYPLFVIGDKNLLNTTSIEKEQRRIEPKKESLTYFPTPENNESKSSKFTKNSQTFDNNPYPKSYSAIKEYNEIVKYSGSWQENKRHGKGIILYANKTSLTGNWVKDNKIGVFTYNHPNRPKLKVNFINEKITIIDENNSSQRELKPIIFFREPANKSVYIGRSDIKPLSAKMHDSSIIELTQLNFIDGPGIKFIDNQITQYGEWHNNQFMAKLIYSYEYNDIAGQCQAMQKENIIRKVNYKENGKVRITFDDNSSYFGEVVFIEAFLNTDDTVATQPCPHGYGTYWCANQDSYTGTWEYGMFIYGTGKFIDSSITDNWNGKRIVRYEGEWRYTKPNGIGTAFFNDGSQYKSVWLNGQATE